MAGVPAFLVSGAGDNTVLFLHGIAAAAHAFNANMPGMPDGWCCLAWWVPGYGESPPLDHMAFESLAVSVIRLLNDQSIDQAVIVGHSMGGMIAQEVVARYPDRVSGLVLFATTAAFGGRDDGFMNKFLAARLKPLDEGLTPVDFADRLVGSMFGPQMTAETKTLVIESMAAVPAPTYRQALTCNVDFDRQADLSAMDCPTLVLAAENDPFAPAKTMARMAEAIPNV